MVDFQSVIPRRDDGSVIDPGSVKQPLGPSGKPAVVGSLNGVAVSANFLPLSGRTFNIQLSGPFVATVQLERSLDGGVYFAPVTVNGMQMLRLTAPASESWEEAEAGVIYRLSCIAYTSGTINYRISQ